MQTAKIKFNEVYAAVHNGKVIAFRPTAIITTTTGSGSTNVIQGYDELEDGDKRTQIHLDPKRIDMPIEQHEALMRARAEADARKKAKEEADYALRVKAVKMLAAAIGAVPVIVREDRPKERGVPQVEASYGELRVNQEAFNKLIEVLEPLVKE